MHNQHPADRPHTQSSPSRIFFSNSGDILAKIAPTPPIPEVSAYRFLVIASESAHNAELHTHPLTHTHPHTADPSASAAKHFVWRIGEREHLRVASKYHAHHLCRHPFSPPARKRHPRSFSFILQSARSPESAQPPPSLDPIHPRAAHALRVKKTAVSRTWEAGGWLRLCEASGVCCDVRGRRMSPVDRTDSLWEIFELIAVLGCVLKLARRNLINGLMSLAAGGCVWIVRRGEL